MVGLTKVKARKSFHSPNSDKFLADLCLYILTIIVIFCQINQLELVEC